MFQNFNNKLSDWLSTGSNLKDGLIGGVTGLGQSFEEPGQYYVMSNWKGNGLANTGIGYLRNPDYRDYFSAGQAMASLGQRMGGGKNKFQLQNILGNLSGLGGKVGGYFHNKWEDLINNRFGNKGDVYVPIDANILGADRIA